MRASLAIFCLAVTACSALPRLKDSKVVNGTTVMAGEIPWQVSLQRGSGILKYHSCGGSILNENWIVCAAHCVDPSSDNVQGITIEAGSNEILADLGVSVLVDAYIQNGEYSRFTFENDISLLHLSTPLPLDSNAFMSPITLPAAMSPGDPSPYTQAPISDTYPNLDYETATQGTLFGLTGWGTEQSGGSTTKLMKKTPTVYVTDANCDDPPPPAESGDGYQGQIKESMICAGGCGEHHDTCQGDSGGPMNLLSSHSSDTEYVISPEQVGIVSWGAGCATTGKPGVYTELAYFVDWISQAIDCYDANGGAANCS